MWETEDDLEIEFKFVPEESEHETVAALTDLFGAEYGFAKWPPCVNLDIYLDTPDLVLNDLNTPLRLRVWGTPFKHKELFMAVYKYPPEMRAGLRRREIKTMLPRTQALAVCRGDVIGPAVEHATASAQAHAGRPAAFVPQLLISSFESIYMLRRRTDPGSFTLARGQAADLLFLSFRHCTVRGVELRGAERLIKNGMLDYDPAQRTTEFFEAELEIVAQGAGFARAEELYSLAHRAIAERGLHMPVRSKYSAARSLLQEMRVDCP